jgi:hypothetical protein
MSVLDPAIFSRYPETRAGLFSLGAYTVYPLRGTLQYGYLYYNTLTATR